MIDVTCKNCGKNSRITKSRKDTYLTCSRKCLSEYKKSLTPKNCKCTNCGLSFHLKECQVKRYNRTMGTFCSMKCSTEYKKSYYLGKNNPNFRGAQYDNDGYRINHYPKIGRVKEHRYIASKAINRSIPEKFIVHHRDCNIYNNTIDNLAILSESDHRWLHKQFGNATLWAYSNKKVSIEELVTWSNEPKRARYLLELCVNNQYQEAIMDYNKRSRLMNHAHECIEIGNIPQIEFEEVENLSDSDRGVGGYGSTGN